MPRYRLEMEFDVETPEGAQAIEFWAVKAARQQGATRVDSSGPIEQAQPVAAQKLVVYADGSCPKPGGPGGWGVHVVMPDGSPPTERCGGGPEETNNTMELQAAIEAVRFVADLREAYGVMYAAEIWTDSQYVQRGITTWVFGWKKNGWRTSAGKPVLNRELWERLFAMVQEHRPTFHWMKGHSGHHGNERADQLAEKGRKMFEPA